VRTLIADVALFVVVVDYACFELVSEFKSDKAAEIRTCDINTRIVVGRVTGCDGMSREGDVVTAPREGEREGERGRPNRGCSMIK
jgi:hypothetical protein